MPEFLGTLSGGGIVALVAIISAAIVLCVLILTVGWARTHRTTVQAALKRDMLARNLSVEEIERLTQSEQLRLSCLEMDQRTKQAQITAELKRDLLARGTPVEEVIRITTAGVTAVARAPGQSTAESEAESLAGVIVQMVKGAMASLDENAVAGLIELYLRHNESQPAVDESRTRGDAVALAGAIVEMVQGPAGSLDREAVAGLIELFLRRNAVQPPAAPQALSAPPREDRPPVLFSDKVRPSLG
jgi:hypothetical protein